jgi:hypothetical protein
VFATEQTTHFAAAPRDERKLVWRDPDGIGRHRASWSLDPERTFHEHELYSMFLFSSLERLVDRHSSRRYADASI